MTVTGYEILDSHEEYSILLQMKLFHKIAEIVSGLLLIQSMPQRA